MTSFDKELESRLSSRVLACPVQGKWSSFQLVDEFGSGEPYAGLPFTAIDSEGIKYSGHLDITGTATITNHSAGPVAVLLNQPYEGSEKNYAFLQARPQYPLKITELQVRAEQTRYRNQNSTRTRTNPAQACADEFLQVEVRHLVEHVSHLPPEVYRHYPHSPNRAKIMGEHGKLGIALMPQTHGAGSSASTIVTTNAVDRSGVLRPESLPARTDGYAELLPFRAAAGRSSG